MHNAHRAKRYAKLMECGRELAQCALVRIAALIISSAAQTQACAVSEGCRATIFPDRELAMQADKVKRPILLIHGEDDNNTGTFPMQVLPLPLLMVWYT